MQLSGQLCHLPGSLQFFSFFILSKQKENPRFGWQWGLLFFSRTGNAKIRGRNSEGEVKRERERVNYRKRRFGKRGTRQTTVKLLCNLHKHTYIHISVCLNKWSVPQQVISWIYVYSIIMVLCILTQTTQFCTLFVECISGGYPNTDWLLKNWALFGGDLQCPAVIPRKPLSQTVVVILSAEISQQRGWKWNGRGTALIFANVAARVDFLSRIPFFFFMINLSKNNDKLWHLDTLS